MLKCDIDSLNVPKGTIHRTIALLQDAFARLKAPVTNKTVERLGIMVHQAMSMQNRSFHKPEHIFDLADPEDPHLSLAAVFHDVVYYQVDNGFHRDIEEKLSPYLDFTPEGISIRKDIEPSDRVFFGTAAVFGFTPGKVLSPFGGLNEFLSALLMNSFLEGKVKDVDLLIATAGIEMTIPFRPRDEKGRSPAEVLKDRIIKTNLQFQLGLPEKEIIHTVKSAVTLANRDISNFAEEEPARFLDNTWKLLPESNPDLFFQGLYTVKSYARALCKMEGFLSALQPERVFQHFAGYPEQSEYEQLIGRTGANLSVATSYLGIKMISAGILQALMELTGGDVPISFIMGDMKADEEKCSLAYYLPGIQSCGRDNTVIYDLLKHGRASSSSFDLKNSPLSFFVYCNTDENTEKECIEASREFLNGELGYLDYLEKIPSFIVESIARAASVMVFTRSEKLEEISKNFSS